MCKNRLHEYSTSAKIATDIDYDDNCVHCRHSAIHTYAQHAASIAKYAKQKLSGKFALPVLESVYIIDGNFNTIKVCYE